MNGDLKHSWGREAYNTWFTVKERSGIARFRLGIGKLRGAKGGNGEGQMPPLRGGGQRISPLVEMSRNTRGGRRSS